MKSERKRLNKKAKKNARRRAKAKQKKTRKRLKAKSENRRRLYVREKLDFVDEAEKCKSFEKFFNFAEKIESNLVYSEIG